MLIKKGGICREIPEADLAVYTAKGYEVVKPKKPSDSKKVDKPAEPENAEKTGSGK